MDGSYCWDYDNSGGQVHPVGQKLANPYGLYDMSGNVYEWCSDWYGENYYSLCMGISNPTGPSSGLERVLRGGSWKNLDDPCRSAFRKEEIPVCRDDIIGFRVVRTP
jgi:formylglycine-generating enzyme required for sulfatase activity